jgi:hypothetical protein
MNNPSERDMPLPAGIEFKAKDPADEFALHIVESSKETTAAPPGLSLWQRARFHFGSTFDRHEVSLLTTNMTLGQTMSQVGAWTGLRIAFPKKLEAYPLGYNDSSNQSRTKHEHLDAIEALLPQHGLRLFVEPQGVAFVLPANEVEVRLPKYRAFFGTDKSMPAKAPSDEAWLNPFGPLTTKAAKAANLSTEESKPYSLLYTYSLIIALVCGTAGLPHILVRFYTNPDGVAAKRTTMWVMILIGVFYVFPPVFGVMGRNLLLASLCLSNAKPRRVFSAMSSASTRSLPIRSLSSGLRPASP